MRKQIVYTLLAAAAVAGIYFGIRSQRIVRNEAYFNSLSQYIYAYTDGVIGRNDAVRVRFAQPVPGAQPGKTAEAGILKLDPAVAGALVWEDDRTLTFQPEQPLPYGRHYSAALALRKLFSAAPYNVRRFDFDFSVRALAFEVETDGVSVDLLDPSRQRITGRVRVNEPCESAQVEKMLEAKQAGRALPVRWTHKEDKLTHEWVVEGVERGKIRSKVALTWSGTAIGVDKKGEAEQIVAAADEFGVLNARVIQVEEQYILLNFSDPLAATQNLEGLIRLEGYDGKLRFLTDLNNVRVYPATRLTGEYNLRVEAGIRSSAGQAMKERSDWKLNFEELNPGVRLVGRGAIIPQEANGGVIFPFEAVGLSAVDVEIFKIYNNNILQFLQVNDLEGQNELQRVGKIVLQKKLDLAELNPNASSHTWQRYALDLRDMIKQDPGAIYQVRLAFRKSYTGVACAGAADETTLTAGRDEEEGMKSIMGGYYGIYWDGGGEEYSGGEGEDEGWWGDAEDYEWSNREDPCKREYYNRDRFVKRNMFVSDLGLTAKRGKDGSVFVAVTNLHSAKPVNNVEIEFFNYQLQPVGKAKTGSDGTAWAEGLRETPFMCVASGNNQRGYLRMIDGSTLSLSRFDVAGVEAQKGLKGYLYGERGVWRPGDSIYLNFVLEDKSGRLPAGHPVTMELHDPRGALQYRNTQTENTGGVYALHCFTRLDAPTGNWTATVKVGGALFSKQLKIETVKPNRLKMLLDFGRKAFSSTDENMRGKLAVSWLHGAVAKNLKAKVEMFVRATQTQFPNFKDFVFDDPARSFYSEPQVLFDAETDLNGQAVVPLKFGENENAPGKLIANFKVRAFEKSGDFSTDNFSVDYFPYNSYLGVQIPRGKWGDKTIDGRGGAVRFVLVDKNGKPQPGREIKVGLFRCDWRWWWDSDATSNVGQFNSSEINNALEQTTLYTDQNGTASWKVKPNGWGRYLVRAIDPEGGHAAGDFFWSGYPQDLDDIQSRNAAAMLTFSVEKEKYTVGDEVTLRVPASDAGRILLTLETGTRVAKHLWFDAKAGENVLKFKAEENMAPTVYAHVSLIQPHAQTQNDLPIRMYGVMPVNVENPGTRLVPQIDMPDVIKPDEAFNVALREAGGRACTYTLAVVDEGLLDLTRFETPNAWNTFYAREALGVKTWDIYDYVLGAYGSSIERILAVGGDGINQKAKNASQVNRFKPAVIHLGPFRLEKGQTAKHKLTIRNYVGSVRVMAVLSAPAAGSKGAYGSAEKTCPVRKPLMILPTLPRVLGPGESLRLPVDVFAMESQVKNATVRVQEKSGLVNVASAVNTLTFAQPGNEMTYFNLKVGDKTGIAKFTVTAQGGGETATQEIELLVRNPNPLVTKIWDGVVEPGKEWSGSFDAAQYSDIANAVLEVSALPPVNMSRHLQYLIQYPHGCIEQTTSAAFPQLFVDVLAPLTQKQKDAITKNIGAAIEKMRNFQQGSGAFSYWPGDSYVNEWTCSYAGHFLVEAKNKGYAVPEGLIERWTEFQTRASRAWQPKNSVNTWENYDHDLSQAYRLYTLALAGKADLAGMNRLREKKDMYTQSAYMLAGAYAQAGKPEVASELAKGTWKNDWRYDWCGYTYGSDLRDRALLLETYTAMGDGPRAQAMLNYICEQLGGKENWFWSTQGLSTSLRALSKYVTKNFNAQGAAYAYRIGGSAFQNGDLSKPVGTVDFTDRGASNVAVKNNGAAKLYTRIVVNGQALVGDQSSTANNLNLSVRYLDADNKPLDPTRISQGTDFYAEVTIKRNSTFTFPFTELALSQIFPSGWEIMNDRMSLLPTTGNSAMDYQDIRDDRVFTYFDLYGGAADMSRTYKVQLNAAYAGRYYLPTVACEGMYDNRVRASVPGAWVEVI